MSENGLYLYGIAGVDTDTASAEKLPAGVFTVSCDGLTAFVSPASVEQQAPSRQAMTIHQKIVGALSSLATIVPVSFGIILRDQSDIIRLLELNREQLQTALARLTGRIEVGLKVFWKKEAFAARFGEQDPTVAGLIKKVREVGEEHAYPLITKVGEVVEAKVQQARTAFEREIHRALAASAEDAVLNDILTIYMVCNAAYLLPKEHERIFDEKVNQLLEPRLAEFDVRYTGPWPPYNFARLRLELPPEG